MHFLLCICLVDDSFGLQNYLIADTFGVHFCRLIMLFLIVNFQWLINMHYFNLKVLWRTSERAMTAISSSKYSRYVWPIVLNGPKPCMLGFWTSYATYVVKKYVVQQTKMILTLVNKQHLENDTNIMEMGFSYTWAWIIYFSKIFFFCSYLLFILTDNSAICCCWSLEFLLGCCQRSTLCWVSIHLSSSSRIKIDFVFMLGRKMISKFLV